MRQSSLAVVAAIGATANAANSTSSTLASVCTVSNVQAALPANGTLLGIDLIPSAVTAAALYNVTSGGMGTSSTTTTYCNVTVTYTHTGKGDTVVLKLAFPQPSDFENRFYVAGGGGCEQSPVPLLFTSLLLCAKLHLYGRGVLLTCCSLPF